MDLSYKALPVIYDVTSTEDEDWQPTLDAVAAAVGAEGALVFGLRETDDVYALNRASAYRAVIGSFLQEFMDRFGHYDAFGRDFLFAQTTGQPFTDHDIWPNQDLHDRDDFRFTREKAGIFLRAGVNLAPSKGWRAGMIAHFHPQIQAVPSASLETLRFLAPHLSKSIELRQFLQSLHRRYAKILAVLDRIAIPLAVCDRRGEAVVVNAAARHFLETADAIGLNARGRFTVRNETTQRQLNAAIAAAATTAERLDDRQTHIFHVPRRDGRDPIYVEVSPMRDGAGEMDQGFTGALVTFIDPDQASDLSCEALATLYSLTPAEAAVAALMLTGLSYHAIADRRGVLPSTIKSQVKSVLLKAQASSRGELIRKAAHLAPPVR